MKKSYILAQYRLHADHDTPHIAHPSGTAARGVVTRRRNVTSAWHLHHKMYHTALRAPQPQLYPSQGSFHSPYKLKSLLPSKFSFARQGGEHLCTGTRLVLDMAQSQNCSGDVSATTAPSCLETRHTWRRNNWSIMKTKSSSQHQLSLDLTEVLLKVSEDRCVVQRCLSGVEQVTWSPHPAIRWHRVTNTCRDIPCTAATRMSLLQWNVRK